MTTMKQSLEKYFAIVAMLILMCVVLTYAIPAHSGQRDDSNALEPSSGAMERETTAPARSLPRASHDLPDLDLGMEDTTEAVDLDGDAVSDVVDACPAEDASGFDADDDGCIDRAADLADLVLSLALKPGAERRLAASAEQLARDEGITALHKLAAFVNKVEARRGRKLDHHQANMLVSFAAHATADLQRAD